MKEISYRAIHLDTAFLLKIEGVTAILKLSYSRTFDNRSPFNF